MNLASVLSVRGTPEENAAFDAWTRGWTMRFIVVLAIVYGGISLLLLWPVDLVAIGNASEREAFGVLRFTNALVCVISIVGLASPFVQRHVQIWGGLVLLAVTTLGAWNASALPHDPFYWPGVFAPTGAMILFVPLGTRVAWCVLIGGAHNVAWYARTPPVWSDPSTLATLGIYVQAIVFGIAVGHTVTAFAWRMFRAQREVERWNERLERDVEDKTREVRRLAERVQHLHEDERRRLAAELHDELGQSLTALRLETTLLERGSDAAQSAASLHARIDEMFEAVRFTVSSLRPKALDQGLSAACEWLVDRYAVREDIAIRARIDEIEIDDDARRLAIFRVLQESLTNALRHADAKQVRVSLAREGASIVLDVQDDGIGFDVKAASEGHGLAAMRERAAAIGAVLEITASTAGTRIRLVVEA